MTFLTRNVYKTEKQPKENTDMSGRERVAIHGDNTDEHGKWIQEREERKKEERKKRLLLLFIIMNHY